MTTKRYNFITLLLLVLFSWSVTVLLGPLVGDIALSFGLENEAAVGNISAIFLVVGGILAFVWVMIDNQLSKRIQSSRKILLVTATLIWVIGVYLTSLAQNYGELFGFQMLTAVGYAAITPLAFSMTMDLTPPNQRAKAFGLLDVAAVLGAGVGFLLSGLLVGVVPWGVPFIIVASFGLILAGFAMNLQEPKRGLQERELREVLLSGAEYQFEISRKSITSMVKNKTNFSILLFNAILYIASGSITYYFIRMMVNDHVFASSVAVLFFLATFSSQAVGAIVWTKRADKKFAQQPNGKVKVLLESLVLGPGFLITAYSLVFTVNDSAMIGLFAALLIVGVFSTAGLIAISFSILGELNPPEMRTTIFSMNNLAQTIGRGAGIFIMGTLFIFFGNTYQWGFAIMGGVYFIAILFALPLLYSVPRGLKRLSVLLQDRAKIMARHQS